METPKDNHALHQQLRQLDSRQERLIDLYSIGSISKNQIEDKIKELNLEREKVKTLLSSKNILDANEIVSLASRIHDADYPSRCDIAELLIKKVVIDGENIRIYWNF